MDHVDGWFMKLQPFRVSWQTAFLAVRYSTQLKPAPLTSVSLIPNPAQLSSDLPLLYIGHLNFHRNSIKNTYLTHHI